MSSMNCPSCNQADELSTPRRPVTIGSKRNTRSVGMRFCSRCDLIIPSNNTIKFWNGREAVGVAQ